MIAEVPQPLSVISSILQSSIGSLVRYLYAGPAICCDLLWAVQFALSYRSKAMSL